MRFSHYRPAELVLVSFRQLLVQSFTFERVFFAVVEAAASSKVLRYLLSFILDSGGASLT